MNGRNPQLLLSDNFYRMRLSAMDVPDEQGSVSAAVITKTWNVAGIVGA
jgi:hypothetical protein